MAVADLFSDYSMVVGSSRNLLGWEGKERPKRLVMMGKTRLIKGETKTHIKIGKAKPKTRK